MRALIVSALVLCTVLTFAGGARAQDRTFVEKRTSEGQDIRFEDDPLDAVGRDTVGEQLIHMLTVRRLLLARPRQTFVPEMLKNIESL
jgi:hypothetical protein